MHRRAADVISEVVAASNLSAGFARNPLRIVECGLRNPQSEIRNPKFLLPGDDLPR
jgi:hypothetical protein